jgi:cytochrome o ubiquinol oxidase subunit 2
MSASISASCLAPGAATSLPQCYPAVLAPQGPIGAAEKIILLDSLGIMLVVVVPVIVAILAFAWWYRASNKKARYLPDWDYSGRIELVVWSIPLLVILFLGGMTWIGAHDLDPAKPLPSSARPLEVQVVSLDWKWLFIYPDQGVAAVNQLIIPTGEPVHFTLTSASVMNTFFVPQLGGMIYTMNGMADQLNLQADRPGTYYGESAHYSGDGFSGMHFEVRAVSPQDFGVWAQGARGAGPTLDEAAYRSLTRQSSDVRPFTYGATAPNLFQAIVMQQLPPGPGPQAGRPTPDVSPRRGT